MPRSGRCSSTAATNAGPSPTAPTTSWPASASSSCRPSRSRSESSATTILIAATGSGRSTTVGRRPRARSTSRRPSTAASRCASPARPQPLAGWAPPAPSSSTRTIDPSRVGDHRRRRLASAPLCLATLVSASADDEVDGGLDVRRQLVGDVERLARPAPRCGRQLLQRGRSGRGRPAAAGRCRARASAARRRSRGPARARRRGSPAAGSGSSSSCLPGPAEVHGQPHQPLLGAVVDVALEPAQRGGLGRPGGVAAALDPAHLLLQLGAAAEQHRGEAGVQDRGDQPHSARQGQQRRPRRSRG